MTIVEFLTERLDEEQGVAEQAEAMASAEDDPGDEWFANQADSSGDAIVAMYPRRALADIAAKRAIVELHSGSAGLCSWSQDGNDMHDEDDPCPTVSLLASIYRDHPDYREEWKL